MKKIVMGGGISGLIAAYTLNAPLFEKNPYPGGLLASYCFDLNTKNKLWSGERKDELAFFEVGGGHWLWGLHDYPIINNILLKFTDFKTYVRRSYVYLTDLSLFIPYPLQYHLRFLPRDIKNSALEELINIHKKYKKTLSENLYDNISFGLSLKSIFGETLYELFFRPYNEMYTAGLLYKVLPPRKIKLPNDMTNIVKGAHDSLYHGIGYNAVFFYPEMGLGPLMWRLCSELKCFLNSEVTDIDYVKKMLIINNKNPVKYDILVAAIPLNHLTELLHVKTKSKPDPYTSVITINVIAEKGRNAPKDAHWIYMSKTKTLFHRIGYYSNVDPMFLPKKYRSEKYVAAYIEKVVQGGVQYEKDDLYREAQKVLDEACELGMLGNVIAYDVSFVDVAYTWRRLNSNWINEVNAILKEIDVIPVGRYATWGFVEGIVESAYDTLSKSYSLSRCSSPK
uniref:Amine oxidase domain-containing protein n=1 Tax=Fervidicoccus fontis TaxID=683846 RepID=A0A7J3SNK2_9CREN